MKRKLCAVLLALLMIASMHIAVLASGPGGGDPPPFSAPICPAPICCDYECDCLPVVPPVARPRPRG